MRRRDRPGRRPLGDNLLGGTAQAWDAAGDCSSHLDHGLHRSRHIDKDWVCLRRGCVKAVLNFPTVDRMWRPVTMGQPFSMLKLFRSGWPSTTRTRGLSIATRLGRGAGDDGVELGCGHWKRIALTAGQLAYGEGSGSGSGARHRQARVPSGHGDEGEERAGVPGHGQSRSCLPSVSGEQRSGAFVPVGDAAGPVPRCGDGDQWAYAVAVADQPGRSSRSRLEPSGQLGVHRSAISGITEVSSAHGYDTQTA